MIAPLLLVACFSSAPPPVPTEAVPATEDAATPPKLGVYVVIDQYSWTLHERMYPHTDANGGFQTAAARGGVGPARYAHATTYTCPGHATLATGASPKTHGIVGNRWISDGEVHYCADLKWLEAQTLADRVVADGGQAVSLSLKDRAALMMGGQNATVSAWFERKDNAWSRADLPYLDASKLVAILDRPWPALQPDLYARYAADDNAYEADIPGLGRTFPKAPLGPERSGYQRYHPEIATELVNAALGAVDHHALGQKDAVDLLAISFSHIDYLGHAYTGESWEVMDAYLRLDRDLQHLIEGLDTRLGADGYVLAIASDHGAAPAGSAHIDPNRVSEAGERAYAALGLPGEPTFTERGFWLPSAVTDPSDRTRASQAIAAAVTPIEGVHTAVALTPSGPLPATGEAADAAREVFFPGRSADVMVLLEPDTVFLYDGEATGTSHGVPWAHDSRVPLFLAGPGTPTAWPTDTDLDVRSIAPTLAQMMGVDAPAQAERPALGDDPTP